MADWLVGDDGALLFNPIDGLDHSSTGHDHPKGQGRYRDLGPSKEEEKGDAGGIYDVCLESVGLQPDVPGMGMAISPPRRQSAPTESADRKSSLSLSLAQGTRSLCVSLVVI